MDTPDEHTFFMTDDFSNMPIFVDCSVGVAEIMFEPTECSEGHTHNHLLAIVLTFEDMRGESYRSMIPTQSALGQAILGGDLELVCKRTLDAHL